MNICKNLNCNNTVSNDRIYCSASCRTKTTNRTNKNYKQCADTIKRNNAKKYAGLRCKQCDALIPYEKRHNKFCASSCSATFNNTRRRLNSATKEKIRNSLLKGQLCKKKACIECGELTNNSKYCSRKCYYIAITNVKKLNSESTTTKLSSYRTACKFNFSLKDYPDRFDFSLIESHGWYKPTNRGNNLYGVSRDHMFSVKDGFMHGVDPDIIKHPANCRLITHSDNVRKGSSSCITLDELMERINNW